MYIIRISSDLIVYDILNVRDFFYDPFVIK